ncbi:MAG: tetratricopeptide repeat protein, partial [Candidatus Zixiibacteriota bacterium]
MKKVFSLFIFSIIISGCTQEPETFEELKKAGEKEFIKENYPAARKYFVTALKLKQSDRDILYFLGLSYQREYLLDSAIYYLKRGDLIYPNDREINLAIYPIAVELQEWENALKAISVLVTTGDPIDKYYKQLVELNIKAEHYIISFIYLKKLLEAEPDNPNWY